MTNEEAIQNPRFTLPCCTRTFYNRLDRKLVARVHTPYGRDEFVHRRDTQLVCNFVQVQPYRSRKRHSLKTAIKRSKFITYIFTSVNIIKRVKRNIKEITTNCYNVFKKETVAKNKLDSFVLISRNSSIVTEIFIAQNDGCN